MRPIKLQANGIDGEILVVHELVFDPQPYNLAHNLADNY